MDLDDLIQRALSGERRAIARTISLVEDGGADLGRVMKALYPRTGSAYSIGITGAPGAGKSTLTERLVGRARADSLTVGVLAIDPSSPFSGGALLGDRVRMQSHATDPDVFIRSMATRGHLGGISLATPEAFRVLDACGKDLVVIETVGVGQAEVEITDACDTTLVVVNPGWGDAVQAAKACLMEIADVFVVNKADRAGTRQAVQELRQMLELSESQWKPEIVETVATKGTGIDELWAAVEKHRAYQEEQGLLEARRRRRVQREIKEIVAERYRARVEHEQVGLLTELTDEVSERRLDPYAAADRLIAALA
ncbi:MAG TPA: methylmalonyl Co-A mutase-associated GTPase MeaB [Actinomycetota bacterium]|nr:methylmalonyl Co-A mutase-associated GTPase MeaB [Actinomycetota bacterium]